jgi:2-C-methyl-D-erythritol 4-phosphate cytidylyltransferase/2-C-methyl-D-erythritol 2,4-cyclodiphosphate synthase
MTTAVIIVAAGEGERFGGELPKQYAKLAGKSMLMHSIELFSSLENIDHVIVAINSKHEHIYKALAANMPEFVFGGARRQDSVYAGLRALAKHNPVKVLTHDAARPLVSPQIINEVVDKLNDFKAVDVASSLQDTIKKNDGGIELLDRSKLYATQTPQGFCYPTLMQLYEKYNDCDATDDISFALWANLKVGLVQGSKYNLKITTPEDLQFAEYLLKHTAA